MSSALVGGDQNQTGAEKGALDSPGRRRHTQTKERGLQKGVSVILTFYSVYFAMTTLETEEAHILVGIQ